MKYVWPLVTILCVCVSAYTKNTGNIADFIIVYSLYFIVCILFVVSTICT